MIRTIIAAIAIMAVAGIAVEPARAATPDAPPTAEATCSKPFAKVSKAIKADKSIPASERPAFEVTEVSMRCAAEPPVAGAVSALGLYDDKVGWKECLVYSYTTNAIGATLFDLEVIQEWYNSAYMTPTRVAPRDISTSSGYGWDESGGPTGYDGVWYVEPWQMKNYTRQKYVWKHLGVTVYTRYLTASALFGPGGKCTNG